MCKLAEWLYKLAEGCCKLVEGCNNHLQASLQAHAASICKLQPFASKFASTRCKHLQVVTFCKQVCKHTLQAFKSCNLLQAILQAHAASICKLQPFASKFASIRCKHLQAATFCKQICNYRLQALSGWRLQQPFTSKFASTCCKHE